MEVYLTVYFKGIQKYNVSDNKQFQLVSELKTHHTIYHKKNLY